MSITTSKVQIIIDNCAQQYKLPRQYTGTVYIPKDSGIDPTHSPYHRIEVRDNENRGALAVIFPDGNLVAYYDDVHVPLSSEQELNNQINYLHFLRDVRSAIMKEVQS